MAQIRVYGDIIRGFIEYTGNTVQMRSSGGAEVQCAIPPGPPSGTFTAQTAWRTNGSAAFLTGLAGSTLVKAFLAWMGTPIPDANGSSTNQNIAVTFKTPAGSNSITGNPAWSQQNGQAAGQQFNIRVADVTSIVKAAGLGQYSVEGIPSAGNYTGWTLAVVWANPIFTTRFISVDTYDDLVGISGTTLSLNVGGFITPPTGTVTGRAAMVVGSAESWTSSGPTKFGPTVAGLVSLSGPNNPVTNFFQMQVNDSNSESATVGQLDQTGTFGTLNSPLNQSVAVNNIRYHWDQTNVSITSGLTNSQTAGVFQFGPVNNAYLVHMLSLQIDVQAPAFSSVKSVDKALAEVGETLTYTVVMNNNGTFSTNNLIFLDTIPTQTSFIAGSVTVDGTAQPTFSPIPPIGFNIGALQIGQTTTITFKVRVTSGVNTTATNTASGNFTYTPATGVNLTGGVQSNSVNTLIAATATIINTKVASKSFADIGDTITYTVRLANTGTGTANNVVLIDTLPNGTTFVTNSLTLNSVTQTGATPFPPSGFSIGTLTAGAVATISFSVRVTSNPNPNPIPNTAYSSGTYTIDPSLPNAKGIGTQSNTVNTQVNNASIPNPSKRVDKAFAKVGDTLLYTIVVQNTGNTSANNVTFKDTIPAGTTFVANSITLNGTTQTGATIAPPTGFNMGTLPAGTTTTLTFQVTVTTIPSPNPIPNSATTTYSYIIDTTAGTPTTVNTNTNIVTTQVNTAIIGTTKTVSASNVFVGDTVTYTMVIRNSGNTTADNVLLTDTIPNGGTFVTDSVTVNGVTQTGINPQTNGVVIPTLPVGGVATVTFKVVLDTIPVPNPTTNTAVTAYTYLLDSSTPTNQSATNTSNTVTTFVNPNSNPLKVVNKTSATVGDTLIYFMQWMNVTNTTQTNVIFVDTLPNGVTFVPNSVTINGVSQPGATITPPNGINTGTLPLDSTVSITYRVIINTIPNPEPIPNTASVTQTGLGGTQTAETNQVFTEVNFAEITQAPKTVDKAFSTIGETLTYTIVLFNNGNTSANNIVITDTIPNGTTFEVNSVTVNGISQPGAVVAPPTGLTLSCIPAGVAATITFVVKVTSIPTPNPTPNTATATYNFVVNHETGQTQSGNINTNTVTTTIVDATIVSTKTVNKAYTIVGDTLTYTIVLTATGNTTANNAIFLDSLPSTLTYVPGSFTLNGVAVSGANPAPPGQNIGSLTLPAVYTITFNAVVNTIPNPNPILNTAQTGYAYTVEPTLPNSRNRVSPTNTVNTTVSQANLVGITKSVDKAFADCGDTLTYTIVIPNSGNATATNVVFKDTVPNGTALVVNSVTVNGTTQTGASPQVGINLGTIAPGATTTVIFKVTVQC